jgi:hypothetical protein
LFKTVEFIILKDFKPVFSFVFASDFVILHGVYCCGGCKVGDNRLTVWRRDRVGIQMFDGG